MCRFTFGISKEYLFGKLIILPDLNEKSNSVKILNHLPLKIENVPLEEMQSLQKHVEATHPFSRSEEAVAYNFRRATCFNLSTIILAVLYFIHSKFQITSSSPSKSSRKARTKTFDLFSNQHRGKEWAQHWKDFQLNPEVSSK